MGNYVPDVFSSCILLIMEESAYYDANGFSIYRCLTYVLLVFH